MEHNKTIFSYQPPIGSDLEIYLMGDFNDWNRTSHPLIDRGGFYEIALQLAPGEYKYHFLINNKIVLDPNAETVTYNDAVYSLVKILAKEEFVYLVPFKIKDKFNYEEVSLVGDFNKWKPNYNRLYKKDAYFSTSLFLASGSYQYKYLAKDDRWFNEAELKSGKDKLASDNKSKNSLIDTSKNYYPTIDRELLVSLDTNELELKQNIINVYRYSKTRFEFKVLIPLFNNAKVKLVLNKQVIDLDFIVSNSINSAFNTILDLDNIDKLYSYKIIIVFDNFEIYANQSILSNNANTYSTLVPTDLKIFSINQDLSTEIMYQIMPDRFCNGDKSLNPNFQEKYYESSQVEPKKESLFHNQEYYHLATWNDISILTRNPYSQEHEADWFVFYGGDLTGVQEKIPYLKELGITMIYFNPLFTAKTPHRYDTIDFSCIDPHLGSNESFQALVSELHENDIKVIIDVALNHCGVDFFAFQDTLEKGDKSDYWSWYDWKQWPLPEKISPDFKAEEYYQCWWGIKDLPEFNYDLLRESPAENKIQDIKQAQVNTNLVNYLLESMKYWVETIGIDGFRLDVPEEVPFWFWKLFRDMLKKINPGLYLVGEIWNNPRTWLQGEYFDAIMNYQAFKDPCVAFFFQNSISLKSFIDTLASGLIYLPEQVSNCQMNLLASHDTIRVRRLVADDLAKLKLALIFQFTFIGIPHIYYGDEVFLDGNKDPDNRRPFPWDYENDEIRVQVLTFYQELIRIRKENNFFTQGKIRFIDAPQLLIYERWTSSESKKCIVIINNSEVELNISNYIKQYPNTLISKATTSTIPAFGYYLATN